MNINWTIKLRLVVMGVAAIGGMFLLGGLGYKTNHQLMGGMAETHERIESSEVLSNLQVEAQALMIAALDAIVERADGRVEDAVREEMGHAVAELREGSEVVNIVAEIHGVPEMAGRVADLTERLDNVIGVELVQAVEARAGDERIEELEHDIHMSGETLIGVLAELRALEYQKLEHTAHMLHETINWSTTVSIIATAAGSVILAVLLTLLGASIIRPLGRLGRVMGYLSAGRLDAEVADGGRTDEIGQMAEAVQVFKDNAIEKARLEEEQAAAAQRAEEDKRRALNDLANRFEGQVKEIVDGVSSAATEMQATAQQMSSTAEETSRQSSAVAAASEQASANVQTVAATAEELSASITEIGRQVVQSARIAGNAVNEAESTNETVQGLSEAASKIGEVVDLINDIAGQTNLLALNATIEAARAGEAGKGFAVVAQEVKNLANQTAKATEEISAQIGSVQEETNDAVGAIEKIRGIIGEVNDIATTISSAVEEQGVSTQEIARNVQQAAQGTQNVSDNIESVNRAAGETGTASGQVLGASKEMARQAENLRGEVERFLAEVRAA